RNYKEEEKREIGVPLKGRRLHKEEKRERTTFLHGCYQNERGSKKRQFTGLYRHLN
ncbi:unnamed protein product, partial [Musa acuminata subsp. burmannicoides]